LAPSRGERLLVDAGVTEEPGGDLEAFRCPAGGYALERFGEPGYRREGFLACRDNRLQLPGSETRKPVRERRLDLLACRDGESDVERLLSGSRKLFGWQPSPRS